MVRKYYFILPILLLQLVNAYGQNFSKEFGKFSKDDIDLKEYALDKGAEAVVLFDFGKSYFHETESSFDVVYERTTRIKILSEAGIRWAEVGIPLYHEDDIYEEVYDIVATATNYENGKMQQTTFDLSNIFNEKINEFWTLKKFAIPNVRVGTILEYKYKVNSQYTFNFRDWEFQWRIPVVYSEYEARMIPFYEYIYVLQGASKFDVHESFQDEGIPRHFGSSGGYQDNSFYDMVHKFGMKNVPAFGNEEYISSINDYIIKLDFQLSGVQRLDGTSYKIITTWPELIKELLKSEDFGRYISKTENISSKVIDVDGLSKKPENVKFNEVLDFVKANYNWNGNNSKFATKTPNQLVSSKVGNSADLNLFTIGLLNSVGIEAYPLILSTRDHGKIKIDYPFHQFFNNVIVLAHIEGKMVLSDASEIMSVNDRIPERCINDKGLVIKKEKVEWINLNCLFTSGITTFMKMDVNPDLIKVDLQKTANEYDALRYRGKYSDKTEKIRESLTAYNYSIDNSSIQIRNFLEKTKPYEMEFSFTLKPEIVNGKIYISPFLHESMVENPLKQQDRKYPVDMIYPTRRVFSTSITIPKGYQVEFKPENSKMGNELFELSYSINADNEKVLVNFAYYFKKSVYQPAEYSQIRFYFNEIVKKGNEKVVLSPVAGTAN